jgi:dihydrofolate reductase
MAEGSKVIYFTASSFNGYIADEHDSLEWLFPVVGSDPPFHVQFMDSIGALVEGSTTYQWSLEHGQSDFCGARLPTFVFTSRERPKPAGADRLRFVSGDVAEVHADIVAAAEGKDIWVVGGGDVAGQFFDAGLLDQLQLSLAPVALTGGAALFPRRVPSTQLRLSSVAELGQFAHLVYDVTRDAATGPVG